MSDQPFIWSGASDPRCICVIYDDFEAANGENLDAYYERTGIVPQLVDRCGNCALRGRTESREAQPMTYDNHGNCICHRHTSFLEAHGITVEQWYQQNNIKPTHSETCCMAPGHKWADLPTVSAKETPQKRTEPIVEAATEPTYHASSGTHFASFEEPVTGKKFEFQENEPVCNTRQEAYETGCDCYEHDRQNQAMLMVLAAMALIGTAIAVAGVIATALGVASALWLAWKVKNHVGNAAFFLAKVIAFPFLFFGKMFLEGVAEMRAEQAQAAPVTMISNSYRVVEPLQLTDNIQTDYIEFGRNPEPVFVNIPGRKANQSTAKMESK